jgi:hypothetical protein
MIIPSQVPNIFQNVYQNMTESSLQERMAWYWEFYYFYTKDTEMKNQYYMRLLGEKGKGLFSSKTLNKMIFAKSDIIQKILRRQTAGIYDDAPLYTINGKPNPDLELIMNKVNWVAKMKKAAKKSLFYNVVENYIRFNEEEKSLCLETLTPNIYVVNTKDYDYLQKSELYISKSRNNSQGLELYYTVWTDTEHYNMSANNAIEPVKNNEGLKNPYGIIPAATLRIEEDLDYWGEPNWELFDAQARIDIRKTNNFFTEMFQSFPMWVSTNIDPKETEALSPNKIIRLENVKNDDLAPSLVSVRPDVDWENLRDNEEQDIKGANRSAGIPANSSSTETVAQSGAAKTIDEIELHESRSDLVNILYYHEIDLLTRFIKVYNIHASDMKLNKIPEGEIDIQYSEEKPSETIGDKVTRRDMEKKYFIKSEVDFVMEDLEVDEKTAKATVEKNKKLNVAEVKEEEKQEEENGNDGM